MQTSTRRGILYPNTTRTDSADVPRDIAALVAALEIDVIYGQGTLAARPISSAGTPGLQGRFYVATDQTPHAVFYDFGTGWDPVGALAAGSVGTTELADNSVTNAKMADNSVNTVEIVDGAVTSAKQAPGSMRAQDYGTVFPTTGLYNGYRFDIFLSGGTGPTIVAAAVYRADLDGTYPWHVKGARLIGTGSGNMQNAGVYADIPSATITLPRAGHWRIVGTATGLSGGGGGIGFQMVVGGSNVITDSTGNNNWFGWSRSYHRSGAAASEIVKMQGNSVATNLATYAAEIQAEPIKLI